MTSQDDMQVSQGENVIPLFGTMVPAREPVLLPRREDRAIFVVRLDLVGVEPPIWRRLQLASDLTLGQLHEVLQVAMGWTDSHLHQFTMGDPTGEDRVQPFITPFDEAEGEEGILESDVRLDQVLAEVGDVLTYLYDFGDGWEHTLRLEAVEEALLESVGWRVVGGDIRTAAYASAGPTMDVLESLTGWSRDPAWRAAVAAELVRPPAL